jgi:integrase
MMATRRRFGRIRQLSSDRWQARYSGPDGIHRPTPNTFATKTDADIWLTLMEAEIRCAHYCVNTEAGIISVRVSVVELARGPLVTGPTKSTAGRRDVTIPAFLLTDVAEHPDTFTAADPRALVFTGPQGAQPRRSNFSRPWNKATAAALNGFHFHDLRHTGNVVAGEVSATLRELMDRMGHASSGAALIYQHRTMQRDKIIADEISRRAEAELKRSGAQRARGKKKRST